jgi:hypothetical protein
MALTRSVQDKAMGLIPMRTPLQGEIRKFVVADTVSLYPGQPVVLSSGRVTAFASGMEVLGVCLEYGLGNTAGTVEVSVCVSPDMTYKILGNDNYGDTATVGYYCAFVDPDLANTDTKMSKAVAGTSTAVTRDNATTQPMLVLGKVDAKSNSDEIVDWFEVKFHRMTFSYNIDLPVE